MGNPTVQNRVFQASVDNRGDTRYFGYTPDASLIFDTEGRGSHPIDTLFASLCACVAHHMLHWLNDRNMPNPGFSVSASGTLVEDRRRIAAITVTSDIGRIANDAAKRKDLMEYVHRCPVVNTLGAGCPIDFSLS